MRLAAAQLSIAERLDRVSLILEPGTITAICGPNGAGKSSLLEALAGLLPAGDGAVFLDRQQIAALPLRERARRIGYLPQAHEIAWDVPVRSLVELGRLPHGDRLAAPVDAALDALDIRDLAKRRAQSLSGGETARVLLARVLAGEPRWLLADEPLASLDPAHQLDMLRLLRRAARSGAGVLLVLHDLNQAARIADDVLVLKAGRLIASGPATTTLSAPLLSDLYETPIGETAGPGDRRLFFAD